MGIDKTESRERGIPKKKYPNDHPYASIQHRVLDSAAYADLTHSARSVLTIITRQMNGNNNGHLQATFSWAKRYGIASEHTLRRAIADLITHGLIYRTRSHGANKAWARYALTWTPIKDRNNLFLDGFKMDSWRDWKPSEKSSLSKVLDLSGIKCSFTTEIPAESAGNSTIKTADYELIPIGGS